MTKSKSLLSLDFGSGRRSEIKKVKDEVFFEHRTGSKLINHLVCSALYDQDKIVFSYLSLVLFALFSLSRLFLFLLVSFWCSTKNELG